MIPSHAKLAERSCTYIGVIPDPYEVRTPQTPIRPLCRSGLREIGKERGRGREGVSGGGGGEV